jgi:thioredoxin-related protein
MEEGEGPALAQRYPIEGYPKMFILNANGDIVQSQLGAIPAEKLIAFGRSALK